MRNLEKLATRSNKREGPAMRGHIGEKKPAEAHLPRLGGEIKEHSRGKKSAKGRGERIKVLYEEGGSGEKCSPPKTLLRVGETAPDFYREGTG